MKNLKTSKELFSPYYKHCLISFSMDETYNYLTEFCRKIFLMASLMRNVPKRWAMPQIFGICYFPIPRFNVS